MEKLPEDEWMVTIHENYIAVAAHLNGGGLYWTKIALSDFPSGLFHIKKLPAVIADIVKRKHRGPREDQMQGYQWFE